MKVICAHCGNKTDQEAGKVNRAKKVGLKLYCNRVCSGLGRRIERTPEQKKKLKAKYDKEFRRINADRLKKSKHEYFVKTYDKEKAAIERKKRMPKHIEYCRQPKYRAWKKEYDKKYNAKKNFGEYWESAILIDEIEKEYIQQEVRQINNLHNKSQKRKRQWKQLQNKNSLLRT